VPAVLTYCPAAQVVQALHEVALLALLYVPALQALHVRSDSALPAALAN
jgi:hypothetical protein